MTHTAPLSKVMTRSLAALSGALLAGLFGAAALLSDYAPLDWAAFAAGAAGLLAILSAIRHLRALEEDHRRRAASQEEETRRLRGLLEDLRPALLFLAEEDAALVSAVSARRSPIAFPTISPQPRDSFRELKTFADAFSRPDDDSFERLRKLGSLEESARALQEAELRFPFVEEILKRVVEHTESAALKLIESFSAIAEQTARSEGDAKKAAASIGSGADSETGLEALILKSYASVTGRTTVLNDFLRLNRENADRIKKMAELVSRSEVLISGINDITERSKLIAFNMAVESAKLGDKGLGFKVIVHELQRLNDQTANFARDIMDIVKSFRMYNQELFDQWMIKSETLTERVREDSEEAEAAVTALKNAYELTGALFSSLTENAIGVNRSMEDILSSLQFQDITRQQIEGVSSFLFAIKGSVSLLRSRYESLGYRMVEPQSILKNIRAHHEPQLKVFRDHDMFDTQERRKR